MGNNSLTVELFTELSVGIVIFGVRFYTRWRTVGFRGYGLDDAAAGVAVVFWILEATFLYTCGAYGSNIGLNHKTAEEVPDAKVPILILGSKLAYAAWIFYILLIWAMKAILLFLYLKITKGLRQHKLVIIMMVFASLTLMASLLWHICSCVPTQRAWQIKPYPGDSCTIRQGNYIIITTLDVVTDLGMMAVILPMLLKAKLNAHRKITLCLLVSSVLFVMVCAIVRAYYSLRNITELTVALGWASREIFAACVVVCAPGIKPLVSDIKGRITGKYTSHSGSRSGGTFASRGNLTTITAGSRKNPRGFELSSSAGDYKTQRPGARNESQERIVETATGPYTGSADSDSGMEHGIHAKTEFFVTVE